MVNFSAIFVFTYVYCQNKKAAVIKPDMARQKGANSSMELEKGSSELTHLWSNLVFNKGINVIPTEKHISLQQMVLEQMDKAVMEENKAL